MNLAPAASRRRPMVWAACDVEGDHVAVRLSGWRKILATKGGVVLPLASIVRIDHDPLARAHVKTGLRQWRKHGSGVWRLGVYHGLDGWSFWSIGVGRNAVLIECSGQRYRFVVVEVADPAQTVRDITAATDRLSGRRPDVPETRPPAVAPGPDKAIRPARDEAGSAQD